MNALPYVIIVHYCVCTSMFPKTKRKELHMMNMNTIDAILEYEINQTFLLDVIEEENMH